MTKPEGDGTMSGRIRDPHVAIARAAEAGRGLRLTAGEVALLAMDSAIQTRAAAIKDGTANWDHLHPSIARPGQ